MKDGVGLPGGPPIRMEVNCITCDKFLENKRSKYCSNQCQLDFQHSLYIERWLKGEENGMQGGEKISGHIRAYLIQKYGNKCSSCGWDKINPTTGRVPIQVDHIDGDYRNNTESNLRLLCPNCHSLTPTYGFLNAGKGRTKRKMIRKMIRNGDVAQLGERLDGIQKAAGS